MKSTTVPGLRYRNAAAAIEWLCKAFGFEVFLSVPGEPGRIEHARLTLGTNMIMLASLDREGDFEQSFTSPADADGVTQCIFISTKDPDRIYTSAEAAGATIIDSIADTQFGRTFSCRDIESHLWVFTSHNPWEKGW